MDDIVKLITLIPLTEAYSKCPRVQQYVLNIPADLHNIFCDFKTPEHVYKMEYDLAWLEQEESKRNYCYNKSIKFGIPLRINESINRCDIRCRISQLKQRNKADFYEGTPYPE